MKNAMTVFNRSLYDSYQMLGTMIWATFFWWLCVLPIFTIGPATLALVSIIQQSSRGAAVSPRDFWASLRSHFTFGTKLLVLHVLIIFPGVVYFLTLISMGHFLSYVIAILLLFGIVMWHCLMMYIIPLSLEQDEKRFTILFKRAFKLFVEHFLFTMNIVLYMVFISIICSIITIALIIWAGIIAFLAYNALRYLLNQYEPEHYSFELETNWRGIWRPWK
ncbi:DUF624 domain-containing protein [Alkalihalobacillus trypoxylicola]|uniref:DUF624 domain-containing protein n=1 Tax=Alkalihalobacillus trypoxylicola TaxID=519424 RepID=A0A161PG78_9BACI|nr:DUF624 domain-containing protein [Alkalihalobacillus trypoxylicola]KYG27712.1 hypothetical protein AZF04_11020 [Alkalihalobacillus trypoxylicola]